MRYFEVSVSHKIVKIEEVFIKPKRYDWLAVVDGVTVQYRVIKVPKGVLRNWFERGTIELEYHARNLSQTGFVYWQKRSPKPRQTSKKEALIKSKMEKLL